MTQTKRSLLVFDTLAFPYAGIGHKSKNNYKEVKADPAAPNR